MMTKVCFVTGCAGFVGEYLCNKLLDLGHRVVGVDNFFSGSREKVETLLKKPNFHFIEDSIENPFLIEKIWQNTGPIDIVFHLAAIISIPYSIENKEETHRINVVSTQNLLKSSREKGVNHFIFAGSAAEYGAEESIPISEDLTSKNIAHTSPYGRSKYEVSRQILHDGYGCALRFFNIYGPKQDPLNPYSGVISKFIHAALHGHEIPILGDGEQTRDFVYIDDVIRAYVYAAGLHDNNQAKLTGVFNVGSGVGTSIMSLAMLIKSQTNSLSEIVIRPERPGDVRNSIADVNSFYQKTGFKADTLLEEGIMNTLKWAKEPV